MRFKISETDFGVVLTCLALLGGTGCYLVGAGGGVGQGLAGEDLQPFRRTIARCVIQIAELVVSEGLHREERSLCGMYGMPHLFEQESVKIQYILI